MGDYLMIKIIVFLFLLLVNLLLLLGLFINGIRWVICVLRHINTIQMASLLKKNGILLLSMFIILMVFVYVTQIMAYTPKIKDSNGNEIQGSIAKLEKVNINGRDEWISIRGVNEDAPIILFLAGGPGGTQMASTRYELAELEKHFVVVNWDQPGSGKSYHSIKRSELNVDTYIEDGIILTQYLQKRFEKEKIYLIGESWGSALGIFLISEKPEYYCGFIGTGQMVDFEETEILDYYKAIELAKNNGNDSLVEKLESQGEPPYIDGNIALKSATYLSYLSSNMMSNPEIYGGYHTFRDMVSSEYGIIDSLSYFLGLMNTFNVVYPQLYDTDLREDYINLKVPVYFFIGRHDINSPTVLAEEYYNKLNAPSKEFVWFEHSGHGVFVNETDLFIKEVLRVFKDNK